MVRVCIHCRGLRDRTGPPTPASCPHAATTKLAPTVTRAATEKDMPEQAIVEAEVLKAQKIVDDMRPLFARGEAAVSAISKKPKKRKADFQEVDE